MTNDLEYGPNRMRSRIEITDQLESTIRSRPFFIPRLTDLLQTCEKSINQMIVIYLVDSKKVFYANKAFTKLLSGNYEQLLEEGWDFWETIIDKTEAPRIRLKVSNYFTIPYVRKPLNLRYHITDFDNNRICLHHEISLHRLEKKTVALNYLFDISDKERIEHFFGIQDNKKDPMFSKEHKLTISTREREVLQLIANGFSSKQIAEILFISNHTAISHRKNLIEKFQVKNTAHLIKKASSFIGN